MGDDDDRQPEVVAQVAEQPQDVVPVAGVERADRLVAEQQPGSTASARAIETRCRWPPEIWPGVRLQQRRVEADLRQRARPRAARSRPRRGRRGSAGPRRRSARRSGPGRASAADPGTPAGRARCAGSSRSGRPGAGRRSGAVEGRPGPVAAGPGRPRSWPGWSCLSRSRRPGRRSRPARSSGRPRTARGWRASPGRGPRRRRRARAAAARSAGRRSRVGDGRGHRAASSASAAAASSGSPARTQRAWCPGPSRCRSTGPDRQASIAAGQRGGEPAAGDRPRPTCGGWPGITSELAALEVADRGDPEQRLGVGVPRAGR